jgi:hypothetical protein
MLSDGCAVDEDNFGLSDAAPLFLKREQALDLFRI